jgi:hypothetical protein
MDDFKVKARTKAVQSLMKKLHKRILDSLGAPDEAPKAEVKKEAKKNG